MSKFPKITENGRIFKKISEISKNLETPDADIRQFVSTDDNDDNSSVSTLPHLDRSTSAATAASETASVDEPMDVDPSSSHNSSEPGSVAGEPMEIDDQPNYSDIHVYPDDVEDYARDPVINQFTNDFLLAMARVAVRNVYNRRPTVVGNPAYFIGYYDMNGITHTVESLRQDEEAHSREAQLIRNPDISAPRYVNIRCTS